jgi:signal transduction histidine kinase
LEKRSRTLYRAYFFALALAASLPLLLGVGIESVTYFIDRQRVDAELRRSEAAQVATVIEAFIDQLTTVLANVRHEAGSSPISQSNLAEEYRRLFSLFRPIAQITLVDSENIERITLDRVGIDQFSGTGRTRFVSLIESARSSGKLQFELAQLDGQSGGQQSRLLVALRTTDKTPYVLIVQIDLRFLNDTLAARRFSNGGYVFLTDATGLIVAHPDAILGLRRLVFADPTRSSGVALAPNDLSSSSTEASKIQFSTHRLKALPWISIAAQPENLANAWIRESILRTVILLGITLLAAALFAAWSARRMLRPISALTNSARDLMLGQSISVHTQSGHRELQQLASQFSQMAVRVSEAQSGLEQKVLEKTRDLAAANQELEVASQHKSEFLAHMSHELRTPLNAVIGFSDLLKAQYFGPLNQKQSEYVRDINASGQHLLSLINDILDLAKVEAGRMELMLTEANVPTLVEACVALVSERFTRGRQTLTTNISADVSSWLLDERKVKQCLLNLLTNASKFTPAGGTVTLRLSVESGHAAGDETQQLVVSVSDTGVGISAEELPQLFTEFYQAKSAAGALNASANVAVEREGTGLGLALTKGFVALHGGTVSVASTLGEGSTFTLRFPKKGQA